RQRVVLGKSESSWVNVLSGVQQGSVLGPILLFADDTKLAAILDKDTKKKSLSDDLNEINRLTNDWLIKLNEEKCKVLHFGRENPEFNYCLNGKPLVKTESERDLGILVSKDLKWTSQINSSINSFCRLYKTFVRPQLEYGVSVWRPNLKKDIHAMESVQRRATKLVQELKKLSYKERLKKTNLLSLEARKARNSTNGLRQTPRAHDFTIERQLVKNCAQRHNFFTNRVSSLWNRLPKEALLSKTTNEFKNKIDKLDFESYYNGLTKLNTYKYKIVKVLEHECACFKDEKIHLIGRNNGEFIVKINEKSYSINLQQNPILTCNLYKSLKRGPNQKVIAYSLYGKNIRYYRLIANLTQKVKEFFPYHVMRIYHDNSIDESIKCDLECAN
ncbi:unnamed protein product, partial [Brachionus calyciflorus]